MLNRKSSFKNVVGSALAIGLLFGSASFAQASVLDSTLNTPLITAGALPDSPEKRIDPNTSASDFSGVVSINVRFMEGADQVSMLCSGALVGKRQVISAGHCVDTDGNGHYVDLKAPNTDVRVVFNSDGFNGLISATKVDVHADYQGFNNCPNGSRGCANDDVAVITLGADAPASAKIYKVSVNPLTSGTHIIMAGYGTTGDGVTGYLPDSADFFIKRTGENYADFFRGDDEGKHGNAEVFYADFDGAGRDTFCKYVGICTPQLPNDREAGIGAGDSGGPSFVEMYGELMLVANNTFSNAFLYAPGTFGTFFGGMVLGSYSDFLASATGGNITFVPEPGSVTLLGLGMLMLLGARRRRSAK